MAIRTLIAGLAAFALAGCAPRAASVDPEFDAEELNASIGAIAQRAKPARLAVAFMDLKNGEVFSFNSETPMPMQSVFKAPLGAAALAELEGRRLSLDEVIVIDEEDLSPQISEISTAWPARRAYTVRELLVRAVGGSDNTAADVLMKRIGGPGAVNAWLTAKAVPAVRVDRYERELQMEIAGLASFRPAWKDETPITAVPEPQRRAALARFLADPRDTATATGLLDFVGRLENGELVSPQSRQLLLGMMDNPAGFDRIRAGLPKGSKLQHTTGTARPDLGLSPVVNDVGIAELPDGRRYAIVLMLSGCEDALPRCEAVLAETTRALLKGAT